MTMCSFQRRRIRFRLLVSVVVLSSIVFILWSYSFSLPRISEKSDNQFYSFKLTNFFTRHHDVPCRSHHSYPFLFPSTRGSVIETENIFPHLNFEDERKSFWNRTFEERYLQIRKTWKQQPLEVIVVPHSHVDPGWLKTYDEYFNIHVSNTLDYMVTFLNKTPEFTFIWSEMSFFSLWWNKLNAEMKKTVIKLLQNGQLEVTTGGWVMVDEATTYYWSIIDQLVEGHQFLKWATGIVPSYSWSVDVFGHSSAIPLLLSSSGMKGMVILRTHYAWKTFLAYTQKLDFFWQTENEEILCHMAPSELYSFKHVCGPNPSKCLEFDFRKIRGEYTESLATDISLENVRPKAERLLNQYGRYASLFPHNVLLVPLGDDFRYDYALEWQQQYQNYAQLFSYINEHKELHAHIRFGTVTDYFNTVRARLVNSSQLTYIRGDFFPYADVYAEGTPAYWTGFYSTRPFLKSLSREVEHWLRASEILYSLARLKVQNFDRERYDSEYKYLVSIRQTLALFQHHDAITGTSKKHVEDDYARKLHRALKEAMGIASHSAQYIAMKPHEKSVPWTSQIYPDVLRPDIYGSTKKLVVPVSAKGRTILLFNSLTISQKNIVKVRVKSPYITVYNEMGVKVQSQINPVWNASVDMMTSIYEVCFVSDIGPLSFGVYKLVRVAKEVWDRSSGADVSFYIDDRDEFFQTLSHSAFGFNWKTDSVSSLTVQSPLVKATFSRSGLLREIYLKQERIKKKVEMNFFTYKSRPYRSGAYLFNPLEIEPIPLYNASQVFPLARVVRGHLLSEVTYHQHPGISLTTRLFHFDGAPNYLELETFYDISHWNSDLELILRVRTNIDNNNLFYTDSNGLKIIRRERIQKLRIQGNYYPVTSVSYIQDETSRLNLLVSESHGVTSPTSGTLEIMLDRRISSDDNRGVGEGVMDNRPTISTFRLQLEKHDGNEMPALSLQAHLASLTLIYPTLTFIVEYSSSTKLVTPTATFAEVDWPVHLINFRTLPLSEDYTLPSNSSLVMILRTNLDPCEWTLRSFCNINFTSVSEMLLTGVRKIQAKDSFDKRWTIRTFNVTFE